MCGSSLSLRGTRVCRRLGPVWRPRVGRSSCESACTCVLCSCVVWPNWHANQATHEHWPKSSGRRAAEEEQRTKSSARPAARRRTQVSTRPPLCRPKARKIAPNSHGCLSAAERLARLARHYWPQRRGPLPPTGASELPLAALSSGHNGAPFAARRQLCGFASGDKLRQVRPKSRPASDQKDQRDARVSFDA